MGGGGGGFNNGDGTDNGGGFNNGGGFDNGGGGFNNGGDNVGGIEPVHRRWKYRWVLVLGILVHMLGGFDNVGNIFSGGDDDGSFNNGGGGSNCSLSGKTPGLVTASR